jgi:hypothetical protein
MEFKKGDRVNMKDGSITRMGTVVEDGIDSKNRVRVKPDGIPLNMSISLDTNKEAYIIV